MSSANGDLISRIKMAEYFHQVNPWRLIEAPRLTSAHSTAPPRMRTTNISVSSCGLVDEIFILFLRR
jgi:hypothetical protein